MSKRLVISVVALLAGLTFSPVLGAQTAAPKATAEGEAGSMEQHPADQTRIRREEVSPGAAP